MILDAANISIDMIDITLNINSYDFENQIKRYIDLFSLDPKLTYWQSLKWDRYRHNWKWETDDYTFFFAYSLNINQNTSTRFRLSYNPNKVSSDDKLLIILLNIFKYSKTNFNIQSFDIAFDYEGITTSDLIFDKGRKKEWKIFNYPNTDYTYYLGKSGINGSIKIYDKASEETKSKANYNKTRYEVTIREPIYSLDVNEWECKTSLPVMYLRGVQGLYDDKDLTDFDKLLIYAIEHDYPMDKLDSRNRQKYKKITDTRKQLYTKIEPSQLDIEKALKEFINKTFDNNIITLKL